MTEETAVSPAPTFAVVNYGAGTNSTAMLIGLRERGERPDLILFADTGGERPETYAHRDRVSDWCEAVGFPRVVTVRNEKPYQHGSLENFCLKHKSLPSIALGFKHCSINYKSRPIEWYLKANGIKGARLLIGIDADESHRAKYGDDDKRNSRYPLIELDWGRDECVEAIARAGLPQPGKSACFFCPSTRPPAIMELKRLHPDLFQRAIAIERNGKLAGSIKGLGRSWSWEDLANFSEAQYELFDRTPDVPCECLDG